MEACRSDHLIMIQPVENRMQWNDIVNTVRRLRIPLNKGYFCPAERL
jgi:hypothetical protein